MLYFGTHQVKRVKSVDNRLDVCKMMVCLKCEFRDYLTKAHPVKVIFQH